MFLLAVLIELDLGLPLDIDAPVMTPKVTNYSFLTELDPDKLLPVSSCVRLSTRHSGNESSS